MKTHISFLAALLVICASGAIAEQTPRHYEGKEAATLDIAFENLSETNTRIADMVADGELEPGELAELHQLTYTSENALAKITQELEDLKETLEVIHKASEKFESSTVLDQAPAYLESSRKLFGR